MEESNKSIQVGLFVTIGIIIFIGSIFLLGGDKFLFRSYTSYHVRLSDVQGISRGSNVSVAGMISGSVRQLKFLDDSNKIDVIIDVESRLRPRITENSTVSVKTQGALGDKYIRIEPGPQSNKLIPENGYIKPDSTPGLLDILQSGKGGNNNFINMIQEMATLLKTLNQGQHLLNTLNNFESVSDKVTHLIHESTLLIQDLRGKSHKNSSLPKTLTRLDNILDKIDKGQGTLGALINDPSVHDRLTQLLGQPPRSKYLKPLIRATIEGQVE